MERYEILIRVGKYKSENRELVLRWKLSNIKKKQRLTLLLIETCLTIAETLQVSYGVASILMLITY